MLWQEEGKAQVWKGKARREDVKLLRKTFVFVWKMEKKLLF